jgi:ribosomal protein S18 acetylase RimI-like enzyme
MSAAGEQMTWYANVDVVRAGQRSLPDGYRIRRVAPADQAALVKLYVDAYSLSGIDSWDAAVKEIAITFAGEYGELDVDASPTIVCGDEVVGSVMTVIAAPWPDTRPVPFVIEAMIDPAHRQKGLAECALRWAAERLAERGEADVGLRVMSDNVSALALYRKLGFSGDD